MLSKNEWKRLFQFNKVRLHWSETWKPLEEWVRLMELNMISHHCKVRRGGEFDRWDLQISTGIFAYVRVLLTVEDHADAKQYLKMRKTLLLSGTGFFLIAGLFALALFALISQGYVAAVGLALLAVYFFLKYITDIVGASIEVSKAFMNLPDGIDREGNAELAKSEHLPETQNEHTETEQGHFKVSFNAVNEMSPNYTHEIRGLGNLAD